jgi:predicted MPP superfamily phosphohydrolase
MIAITHNPDIFPAIPESVALTLAGHTHGGQVDIPFVGRPVVPSRFGQRYAAGLIQEGTKKLFVTTGIGTSIIPVRFRVPPEIVILILKAA